MSWILADGVAQLETILSRYVCVAYKGVLAKASSITVVKYKFIPGVY